MASTSALTFYPLPRERKLLVDDSGFAEDRPANPVTGFSMRRRTIPLLLGEKAGLREDVTPSHKCCNKQRPVIVHEALFI
jgi:hypothetical protein